jgi:hypothetical protein
MIFNRRRNDKKDTILLLLMKVPVARPMADRAGKLRKYAEPIQERFL